MLDRLAPGGARAVIINVGTDLAAALAAASAVRIGRLPTVVINCDPTAESREVWAKLSPLLPDGRKHTSFNVIEAPLRPHGETLDQVFAHTIDDRLVFLDSDAEIRRPTVNRRMLSDLAHPNVFASGFRHGPYKLFPPSGHRESQGWLMERPWMALSAFNVGFIRKALGSGVSFAAKTVSNEFTFLPPVQKLLSMRLDDAFVSPSPLARSLFGDNGPLRRWRNADLGALKWARGAIGSERPAYLVYDTGAQIFEWCRGENLAFVGPPISLYTWDQKVETRQFAHYHGMTRARLEPSLPGTTGEQTIADKLAKRLRDFHGIDWHTMTAGRRTHRFIDRSATRSRNDLGVDALPNATRHVVQELVDRGARCALPKRSVDRYVLQGDDARVEVLISEADAQSKAVLDLLGVTSIDQLPPDSTGFRVARLPGGPAIAIMTVGEGVLNDPAVCVRLDAPTKGSRLAPETAAR